MPVASIKNAPGCLGEKGRIKTSPSVETHYTWGSFPVLPIPSERNRLKKAKNPKVREALNKWARAGSERFFVRQKNGKQGNTVCISCFSFCMAGEKDKLSSRRRFVQRFLSSACFRSCSHLQEPLLQNKSPECPWQHRPWRNRDRPVRRTRKWRFPGRRPGQSR